MHLAIKKGHFVDTILTCESIRRNIKQSPNNNFLERLFYIHATFLS